ncbi:hypothetical protein CROQUDRAFT_51291 [Cronartium quercuum f. sp. fusiforme G11]|uniref:FAD-binding PCMH-type domain-containing protein n=1 Tax=Cronartium quercuum f. sp. fusiforme G11 TaxID=708437 RepID=A0A9P6T7B1_9BASI|nr:hypothetical protein CROQUDRAFT_51291 [Cronartium quercuum f. sp. fusiforme G11]
MLISLLTLTWALCSCVMINADTASLRQAFSQLGIDAFFPGDSSYNKFAAAFNQRFTIIPAAIVFPNNTQDVSNSIGVAVKEKLPVSPRSGGHSYAAYGLGGTDGALVVDLSRLRNLSVDQTTGHAVVGSGNRLGDVAIGLNSQGGRAIPHGTCPYVGMGGHAAFGGYGYTSRQWGLTLDNIIGHEIVLANGSVVETSQNKSSDLFWASRGAGASFGIIVSFKFQTYPAPSQTTGFSYQWDLSRDEFADALIKYQAFCYTDLPASLGLDANLYKGSSSGRILFNLVGGWFGDNSGFAAAIQPFLAVMPKPTQQSVTPSDWLTNLQGSAGSQRLSSSGVDLTAEHNTFYAKSLTTPASAPPSNASLRAFSQYLSQEGWQTSTYWMIQFELYGGSKSAVTSVDANATAFAQRNIFWTIQFYTSSSNRQPPFPDEGLTFLDKMMATIVDNNPSGWQYGAYANYVDDRLAPAAWKSLYYNTHYQRLTEIKSAYDPQNVFSYPQSITE